MKTISMAPRARAALALGCGALAAALAWSHLRQLENEAQTRFEMTTVVRARRYLPKDKALSSAQLEVVSVPVAYVQPTALKSLREIENAKTPFKARYEILAGEQICLSRLYQAEAGEGLAWWLAPGQRAVTLRLSAEDAVGGFLVPGDRVDVFLASADKSVSAAVLSDAPVLAINGRFAGGAGASPEKGINTPDTDSALVTLAVSPQSAGVLARFLSHDRLVLALRPPMDATASAPLEAGGALR